jgi:hypothetical protein
VDVDGNRLALRIRGHTPEPLFAMVLQQETDRLGEALACLFLVRPWPFAHGTSEQ